MRAHLSLLLIALPTALQGQALALKPAPSPLFARGEVADSAPKPHRMTVMEGGGIGATIGIAVGFALGAMHENGNPCSCDDPGLEKFEFGILGGALGFLMGASTVDERRQHEAHPIAPGPTPLRVPDNGTAVTGDSLRLVGKDPHGVRGGIAGALMGGAVGFGGAHLAYSIAHSGGYADGGGSGSRSAPAGVVAASTLVGALSGYLIASHLSRR